MPDYESYDFSGGVNKRLSPLMLLPNELADAQNVLPEERGSIQRRYGFTAYNDTQADAGSPIKGLHQFYGADLSDMLVAACGGKILNVPATDASTDLGDEASFTVDTDANVYMVQDRDRVYGTAWGSDNQRMFVIAEDPNTGSGAMAWPMGTEPPAVAPTTAAGASGALVEGHVLKYAYSFHYGEDGGHGESNTSPTSTFTVTATNSTVVTFFGDGKDHLTCDAALDAGIDQVTVYRTTNGSSDLKFLIDITLVDATSESWTDDGDPSINTAVVPYTDHYGRQAARYICTNNDQMFFGHITGASTEVQWAPPGYPDIRAANNYTTGSSEHGAVMGLAAMNGTVYVFYESAIAALRVQYGSTHTFRIVTTKAGVKAPRSLVVGKERGRAAAYFLSYDHQVYVFDGLEAYPVSDDIAPILKTDANQSYMHRCAGGWDGECYYLSYPYDTDTVPSRELRYNTQVRKMNERLGYDTGTWWPQVLPPGVGGKTPNVYHQLTGADDAGELYWGNAQNTGWIFQHNSGNDDDGTDISSMFQTGLNHLGSSSYQKRLRDLLVDMRTWTYLNFRWDLDFDTQAGAFQIPENVEVPEYDSGYYYDDGNYYVGEAPTRTKHPLPSHYEGNRFRVKVTGDESNAPYKLYGWTVRYDVVREDKAS